MSKRRREQTKRAETETEGVYEVEQILDKRLSPNGLMYLIRWKGYPDPSDYTWEPIQHLTEVEDLVRKFNEDFELQQRVTRQKSKVDQPKPNRAKKQQVQQYEEEENSEPPPKKPSRKRKLPSEEKSEGGYKQTSGNEEDDQEDEIANRSKPRKVEPRKAESKKEKDREKEKEKDKKKGKQMQEKMEVDRFWEDQGLELGRIHKHYLEEGKLVFSVNLNKEELVFGMTTLRIAEMRQIDEEKLLAYMENWARNYLIDQAVQTTEEYKKFENFWRSVD